MDDKRDPQALEVLKKAIKAKGGAEAIQAFNKSYLEKECSSASGSTILGTSVSWRDNKAGVVNETFLLPGESPSPFRQVIKLGDEAWVKYFGGTAVPCSPRELESLLYPDDVASVLTLVPLLADKKVQLRLEPPTKIGEQECVVVSAERSGRVRVVFSFDKERMLLVRYSVDLLGGADKGQLCEYTLSDHREYAGVVVPQRGRFSINGKPAGSYKILEYTPLKELPADVLTRP
jgi:hypothetical protein